MEVLVVAGPHSRRERKQHDVRSKRVNLSFNEFELEVVRLAAERDGMAVGAWAARAAVLVAKEQLVPVSADARTVLQELVRARVELSRLRAEVASAGVRIAAQTSAGDPLVSFESVVSQAVRRIDGATLQVMRERVERS